MSVQAGLRVSFDSSPPSHTPLKGLGLRVAQPYEGYMCGPLLEGIACKTLELHQRNTEI